MSFLDFSKDESFYAYNEKQLKNQVIFIESHVFFYYI